jgi:hypothetical protein
MHLKKIMEGGKRGAKDNEGYKRQFTKQNEQ